MVFNRRKKLYFPKSDQVSTLTILARYPAPVLGGKLCKGSMQIHSFQFTLRLCKLDPHVMMVAFSCDSMGEAEAK